MGALEERLVFGGRLVSVDRVRGGEGAKFFSSSELEVLLLASSTKVRCLIRSSLVLAANFVVDPRICLVRGVEASEARVGLSAFDFSGGELVDTDFVLLFENYETSRRFCDAFCSAQSTMAAKMLDDLFAEMPAETCFEEGVLRTARALATGHCGGEFKLAKQILVRMLQGTLPIPSSNVRVVVDAVRAVVDKLPADAARRQPPSGMLTKTKRLRDVLGQLDHKIAELEQLEVLGDEQRAQKLVRYRFQHKIVATLLAQYKKIANAPDDVSELDLEAARRLLAQVRAVGETCRKTFEGEILKLISRLEAVRQGRRPDAAPVASTADLGSPGSPPHKAPPALAPLPTSSPGDLGPSPAGQYILA